MPGLTARADLEAIAGAAPARPSPLPPETPCGRIPGREIAIPGWTADGTSVRDVALVMARSAAAIETQPRAARTRRDVEATAQAVARAARPHRLPAPRRDEGG